MLRQAHLWLGWATASWLMLMAATGTLLLFKPQLKALTAPPCPAGPARPLPQALQAIEAAFQGRVRLATPASDELCLHEVIFKDGRGGAYVDPTSLRTLQVWGPDGRLTDLVLELHRHLLLQDVGKLPTAVFAVATLALALAGLTLALRRPGALSLRLRPLALTPGALLASHRNIGVLLAFPLAFMAASGWALTYPQEARALLARAAGESPGPPQTAAARELGTPNWSAALAAARAAFPGLEPRSISWPARPGGAIVVRFRQPGEWGPNGQSTAAVAPVSGRLLARSEGSRDSRAMRIWAAIHPLHAGQAPRGFGTVVLVLVGALLAFAASFGVWAQTLRMLPRKAT